MIDLIIPVDVVALLANYLASRGELDSTVGENIYGGVLLPPEPGYPCLTFHLATGSPRTASDWLDRPVVQLDVWGERDKPDETEEVVQLVRSLLAQRQVSGEHSEGVVTASEEITGPSHLWDAAEGRDRFTWTVRFYTHPSTVGS